MRWIGSIRDRINEAMMRQRVNHWFLIWMGPRRSIGIVVLACLLIAFWNDPRQVLADWDGTAGLWILVTVGMFSPKRWQVVTFTLLGSLFLFWGVSDVVLNSQVPPKFLPFEVATFLASLIFYVCSWLSYRELKKAGTAAPPVASG